MDSIELTKKTAGKVGQRCSVKVANGDTYTGIFNGYDESTPESPLALRLRISKNEADRIGAYGLEEIGIRYEHITGIEF